MRSERSAVVDQLLERAGIVSTEECAQEIKDSRIKRDATDLLQTIDSRMNPFVDVSGEENLYSVESGKAVSRVIATELPKIYDTGSTWYKSFQAKYIQDNSKI